MSKPRELWARTEGYRYYGAVILGAGAISILGNGVAYLLDELPRWAALAIHCSPPAIAILMIHLVYEIHDNHGGAVTRSDREVWALLDQPEPAWRSISRWHWIRRARLRWQVGRLAMVSVLQLAAVGVVGLALVYSYGGLQTLAAMAEWSGWRTMAFPVLIDAPAFIATIGVIQVMRQRRLEREARVAEEQAAQSGEPMSDEADDARAEVVSRRSDHEAPQLVDRPAPWHAAQAEPPLVAQFVDRGSAPVAQPVDHGVIREPARPVVQAAHTSDLREPEVIREGDEADQMGVEPIPADLEQVIQEVIREANQEWFTVSRGSDEPADRISEPRPSREPSQPSYGSVAAEDRLAELARQTAEALGGDADEALIRQALALQESGLSLRKTSVELDVPYSTLRRWVTRAKELAEATPRLRVISN